MIEASGAAVKRVRILIADDHTMIREGFKALIEMQSDLEWLGEASDGEAAVHLADTLKPDVIVMDLRMPKLDGFAAIKEIRRTRPNVAILVMSSSDDSSSVMQALQAGARGYITKDAAHGQVLSAIRSLAQGGMIFGDAVAAQVLESFRQPVPVAVPKSALGRAAFPDLTDREFEVLEVLARGLRNREIATALNVSDKTVRNHVSNIVWKLQVADRDGAVARAHQAGLLGRDSETKSDLGPTTVPNREQDLELLRETLFSGRTAFITGAAGVGKTWLLQEYTRRSGLPVHLFQGLPGDARVPFATVARFVQQTNRSGLELPDWVRRELARIVPEFGDAPTRDAAPEDHLRLFKALSWFIRQVIPYEFEQLVLVDDMHFFDAMSNQIMGFETMQARTQGALRQVVLSYSDMELPSELLEPIQDHVQAGLGVVIHLLPIQDEVARGSVVLILNPLT